MTDSVYLVKAIKIPDLLFASISSQIDRIRTCSETSVNHVRYLEYNLFINAREPAQVLLIQSFNFLASSQSYIEGKEHNCYVCRIE